MSFVLFAFLLLFECIKPFGLGLFARTASALARLLVLLLLELQRLLRFGADADWRGLPSGFPLCPFGIAVCRLYGSLNSRTTYRLWCTECTLRFYLCSFIIAWKCRMRLKILICRFDMPAS